MKKEKSIILFNQKDVRRVWNEDEELWYFSVVDIIEVLTESSIPKRYWSDLKVKLKKEWSEVYEKIVQLKLLASDWKKYFSDCFSTENILRLIQSVPSPKAEPFKIWLAKVWYERIEETEDPELSFDRAMETYLKKWYSKDWINQRLKSIEIRKELTDEWNNRWIEKWLEYSILTDEITKAWSWKSVKEYKKYKSLKKENLRDNMTNLELVFNMLAEASTKEISEVQKPKWLDENKVVANKGWTVAKKARLELEEQIWDNIISYKNALNWVENLKNRLDK